MAILSKIKSLFAYEIVALFAIIYTSSDTLLFGTNGDDRFIYAKYAIIIILILYGIIKCRASRNLIQKSLSVFFILVLFFFINALFTGFHLGFLYNIALFLLALTYAWNVNAKSFVNAYRLILFILALFSLVVHVVVFFNPGVIDLFPQQYNTEGLSFHCAYLTMIFDSIQIRNFGLFREPGVYMIYLNFALFIELFSEKPSYLRALIYLLASLTTISTAGIATSAVIVTTSLLFSRKFKVLLFLLPVSWLIYYLIIQMPELYDMLFYKIENQTYSSYARIASFVVPFDIIYLYPLGAGPEAYNNLFPILSNARYSVQVDPRDSTNTILKFLAVYGPLVFGFMLYYLYKFTRSFSHKVIYNFLFFVVLLVAISNEDLRDSSFFYLLIAFGTVYAVSRDKMVINN